MKKRKLGIGFATEIDKVNFKSGVFSKKDLDKEDWKETLLPNFNPQYKNLNSNSKWTSSIFFAILLTLFFVLTLRLFHLQIAKGKINRELADGNRIQIKKIHAPRGVIFDRNGNVLAANAPAFRLIEKNPPAGGKKVKFITREQALSLEVKNDPRARNLEIDNIRTYPEAEVFAHVLGYVGEITESELKLDKFKGYKSGEIIGKNGIEAKYESLLKGIDGGEIIEVDSMGREIRVLGRNDPIPGKNIYLTIDAPLQKKAYQVSKESLDKSKNCCLAIVAMDPKSGQILTLFSLPSFNPNIFIQGNDEEISKIFADSNFPLLDRVISGTYPPASTFKIVSALAALDSGKITSNTSFIDSGIMYLGPYKFTNWYFNQYGKVEGSVDLFKALQRSNDTYFYHISRIIGEKYMIDWARKMGLGAKTGIDLPDEGVGLIPDSSWKEANYNEVWYPGDTLHMSIGQGFVLTTPLQVLTYTSFIAGNGKLFKPFIMDRVLEKDSIKSQTKSEVTISNLTDPKYINLIQKGLELVTKEGGTAWPFFTFPIESAGKTGTAEFGDPKERTHAWYTSYAPVNDPKIVLTVLVEAGGEGSSTAAPIAKEIYRWYFSLDKNDLIKDIYYNATESSKSLGE